MKILVTKILLARVNKMRTNKIKVNSRSKLMIKKFLEKDIKE